MPLPKRNKKKINVLDIRKEILAGMARLYTMRGQLIKMSKINTEGRKPRNMKGINMKKLRRRI